LRKFGSEFSMTGVDRCCRKRVCVRGWVRPPAPNLLLMAAEVEATNPNAWRAFLAAFFGLKRP
jgi:hypothetical protein